MARTSRFEGGLDKEADVFASWQRTRTRRIAAVVVAVISCFSCTGAPGADRGAVTGIARAFPQVSALLAAAKAAPLVEGADGFVWRGLPREDAPSPSRRAKAGSSTTSGSLPKARLGVHGDEPFQVMATGGVAITVRRAEAQPVVGQLDGGAVFYGAVFPGADALALGTRGGLEELLVVRGAGARIAYDVALPEGWKLAHDAHAAAIVELRDAQDVTRLRMLAGPAWDASGARVDVHVAVTGSRIAIGVQAAAWPVMIDPEWKDSGTMVLRRSQHTATPLSDGTVLIAGGDLGNSGVCEIYDPQSGTYTTTGTLLQPRENHTASLLPDGTVLVAGGRQRDAPNVQAYASAEIYDPTTRAFKATGAMTQIRYQHVATRLPDGTVLVTGGLTAASSTIFVQSSAAEIFDPKAGTFSATSTPMGTGRADHTATFLRSGSVLIAGGGTAAAELYDPGAHTFTTTGMLGVARAGHTATTLPSGDVLITGGASAGSPAGVIYSVAGGQFTAVLSDDVSAPVATRSGHTATLLPSGSVLVVGGRAASDTTEAGIATEELFDLRTSSFTPVATDAGGDPSPAVWGQTATLLPSGRVLIAGGESRGETVDAGSLYANDALKVVGSSPMTDARAFHTATALADGKVLVVGGLRTSSFTPQTSAELYDPTADAYSRTGSLVHGRYAAAAAHLPSGKVLVAGGTDDTGTLLRSAELYDPVQGTFSVVPSAMVAGRMFFTATTLPSGRVLLVGGHGDPSACGAELFDPTSGSFTCTSPAHPVLRKWHTATLLPSGKVLVAGGWTGASGSPPLSDAEIFDPTTGAFTASAAHMATGRFLHGAALAGTTGRVLLAGGVWFDPTVPIPTQALATADLYDPATDTITATTGPMNAARALVLMATLPASGSAPGKVLVAGGGSGLFAGQLSLEATSSAELYDPTAGTFTAVGSLSEPRQDATITTLSDGGALVVGGSPRGDPFRTTTLPTWTSDRYVPGDLKFVPAGLTTSIGQGAVTLALPDNHVLVAGGLDVHRHPVAAAGLLDPSNPLAVATGVSLLVPRANAAAVLLDARTALVAGGVTAGGLATAEAETFDVTSHTFAAAGTMAHARTGHTATRLSSGAVLLAGGQDENEADVGPAELYDPATQAFTPVGAMAHPRASHTAALLPSGQVLIAGGSTVGQSAPPGLELYDPATATFSAVASPFITGVTSSTLLPSGDVFLAGDGLGLRYDWKEPGFQFFYTVNSPFGAATLLNGDVAICGTDVCDWLGAPLRQAWFSGRSFTSAGGLGSTLRLPSGKLLVLAPTALGNSSYAVEYQTSQAGTVPPVIQSIAVHSVGTAIHVTVNGTGFTRSSAAGSQSTFPDPSIVPVACFMPDQGGGPLFSSLASWADTSLEWIVPTTSYHGPGWLYVITNGVASEGTFLALPASSSGTSCNFDGECGTGLCVAGADATGGKVCCDTRCDGACESCRAKDQASGGVDGVCSPIAAETDPKNACAKGPQATCEQTGLCNGAGACACIQCRSTLDCLADEVCSPDGRCERFTPAPTPTDPGCSASGRATRAGHPACSVSHSPPSAGLGAARASR